MSGGALLRWGPLVAALVAVFWWSSLPQPPGAGLAWDKLLHAGGYAGIGLLALRAFHGELTTPRAVPTLATAAFMLVWVISDEYHQSFVPGRDASGADVVADLVGFAVACGIAYAWGSARRPAASARS